MVDQVVRKLVGPRVELGVAEVPRAEGDREGIRRAGGLFLEQSRQRRRRRPLDVGDRRVPLVQDPVAFFGRQQIDQADLGIPGAVRERGEEPQEPIAVRGQLPFAVAPGIGVELEPQVAGAGVHRDGQVVDRTRREVVHAGRAVAEDQVAVEGLDVDHRPEQRPVRAQQLEVPAQVLAAVVPVPAQLPHGLGDLRNQLRPRGVRGDAQPQRKHIDDHAGHAQRSRPQPPHHRQPEHDVPRPGHPVQIGAEGRDERVGPDRAAFIGGGGQGVGGTRGIGLPVEGVPAGARTAGQRQTSGRSANCSPQNSASRSNFGESR